MRPPVELDQAIKVLEALEGEMPEHEGRCIRRILQWIEDRQNVHSQGAERKTCLLCNHALIFLGTNALNFDVYHHPVTGLPCQKHGTLYSFPAKTSPEIGGTCSFCGAALSFDGIRKCCPEGAERDRRNAGHAIER